MKKLFNDDSVILSKTTGEPVEGLDIIYAKETIELGEYTLGEDDILVHMSDLSDKLKSAYLLEINKQEIAAKGTLLGVDHAVGKFIGIIGEDYHFDKEIMSTSFNIPMPHDLGKAIFLDRNNEYYSMESLSQKETRTSRLVKRDIPHYSPSGKEREEKYQLMIIMEEAFIPKIEDLLDTGTAVFIKNAESSFVMSQEDDKLIISENGTSIFEGNLYEYIEGTLSVDFLEPINYNLASLSKIGVDILAEKYALVDIPTTLTEENTQETTQENTLKQ